jgi:ribosomal protein L11 methyltransferase
MDPGMAFGTGLHPSTQLCLEELEDWVKLGDHVLDLGTGSGILALAAARLGAQRVIAVDTDPEAVAVARRNVQANALEQHILVAEGSLPWATGLIETSFDLVAANLTATGIARMAPLLWDAVKDGGTVIAGGIVGERKAQTEEALRKAGFALVKERSKGDWYVLVAQRSRL